MASPVNPGKVEWSGENPGIYLKDDDGNWKTLSVFFKVVTSPLGRGIGALLLGAPYQGAGFPAVNNVFVTDNQPLMRWLIANFVSRFPSFSGAMALGRCPICPRRRSRRPRRARQVPPGVDLRAMTSTIVMRWEDLAEPFAVDVAPAMSATKQHQMYSVFVEAQRGTIAVNGAPLPGNIIQRNFLDRRMSTAFLAFSETWITPPR